jgi:hypothetical protein
MRRRSNRSSRAGDEAEAEKWCSGRSLRIAIERSVDRREAAIDLRFRGVDGHAVEQWVCECVVCHSMAVGALAADELRVGQRIATQQEERSLYAFVPEDVEHPRCRG